MTNESAKFLLSAYCPNGADAHDPVFKEALEQAQCDPELAAWFRGERDFDEIASSKLRSIAPPASVEAAIHAGLRATFIPRQRFIFWPAIAAASWKLSRVHVWLTLTTMGQHAAISLKLHALQNPLRRHHQDT